MSLKTSSMVKPSNRKGSRINQTSGRRNIMTKASGQHITNKIHQRIMAIKVFMIMIYLVAHQQMTHQINNHMVLRVLQK